MNLISDNSKSTAAIINYKVSVFMLNNYIQQSCDSLQGYISAWFSSWGIFSADPLIIHDPNIHVSVACIAVNRKKTYLKVMNDLKRDSHNWCTRHALFNRVLKVFYAVLDKSRHRTHRNKLLWSRCNNPFVCVMRLPKAFKSLAWAPDK